MTTPAGWRPDPDDPRRLRWWDGMRWHDLTVPAPDEQKVPPPPDGLIVQIKAASPSFWAALGFGVYFVVALAIADATADEAGSYGSALFVALIGLALLLIFCVAPIVIIGGYIVWVIYQSVTESMPTREERRERRRADRAARRAGLPTQRQARRQRKREERLKRARR